ncbi:MAG: DHH family phosphoesterase [Nanoarchaeota archaeon]
MILAKIKEALETSTRPLFLFDDDPDGLSSFLMMYRKVREGKGIIVKTTPKIDMKFVRFVEGYLPDKVFILDIASVEDEFIEAVNVPIVVIDHHQVQDYHGVTYYNSRMEGEPLSTSGIVYSLFKEDLWIATVGCLSDWQLPPFIDEFAEKYPDLMGKKDIETLLFHSPLGTLARVFSFNLKGKTSDVRKSLNTLTRIEHPDEILHQETPGGKFIWKRYLASNTIYEQLCAEARKCVKGHLLLYEYNDDRLSLSKDLANQMLHEFPEKVVIVARRRNGQVKMSTRSKGVLLPPIVAESLKGLQGHGGGHEHACGVVVSEDDFGEWLSRFSELSKE